MCLGHCEPEEERYRWSQMVRGRGSVSGMEIMQDIIGHTVTFTPCKIRNDNGGFWLELSHDWTRSFWLESDKGSSTETIKEVFTIILMDIIILQCCKYDSRHSYCGSLEEVSPSWPRNFKNKELFMLTQKPNFYMHFIWFSLFAVNLLDFEGF